MARPISSTFTRVAVLQINPSVGNYADNQRKITDGYAWANKAAADLVITPELALCGYPPEDLLHRADFVRDSKEVLGRAARSCKGRATLICGFAEPMGDGAVANSAAIIRSGRVLGSYRKMILPNYGVFDEKRYFEPGGRPILLESATPLPHRIALSICEDIWPQDNSFFDALAGIQPDILINLSASPYERPKFEARVKVLAAAAKRTGAYVVYVNLVGGQDELVFDGQSLVVDPRGKIMARGLAFEEDRFIVDLPLLPPRLGAGRKTLLSARVVGGSTKPLGKDEEILKALELGLKDYVAKNGFRSVGISMSGGIDSALVAALAVRALGKDRVFGVTLPSSVTGRATLRDAEAQAKMLGIRFFNIPISSLQNNFLAALTPAFEGKAADVTEENLQARIRGTIMMALSNKLGFLLLATGNKSELATGYCTLYGDMAGGFAPIKDLTKTWVYRIARTINRLENRPAIPPSVIRRAPTAELRPGQKDQDTLPPYATLDAILEGFIEKNLSPAELVNKGFNLGAVSDTVRRVALNEYKRRQAPPGPKISGTSFGRDRRMPITQKYYA